MATTNDQDGKWSETPGAKRGISSRVLVDPSPAILDRLRQRPPTPEPEGVDLVALQQQVQSLIERVAALEARLPQPPTPGRGGP